LGTETKNKKNISRYYRYHLYLKSEQVNNADNPSRQRLRSSTTDSLSVPAVRLSTVGRHAFPVTDACIGPMERFTFTHYLLTVSAYILPTIKNALIPSLLYPILTF